MNKKLIILCVFAVVANWSFDTNTYQKREPIYEYSKGLRKRRPIKGYKTTIYVDYRIFGITYYTIEK